ncbi:hypothetical protein Emag_005242 [Eimeria magna]
MAAKFEGEHSLELPSGPSGPLLSTASRSLPHPKKRSATPQYVALFSKQRHAKQKALAASGVLAVILASLALVYLTLMCLRHMSGAHEVNGHRLRFLASSSPPDDSESCLASLAEGEEQEQGEEGGAAVQEGASEAPTPEVVTGHNWRGLPPAVEEQVRDSLALLAEPLIIMRRLLPVLRPTHAMSLTWVLGRMVCLELSAFALAPASLELLKAEIARAYAEFIEELLTTGDFARQAEARVWENELRIVQVMVTRLAWSPRAPQRLAPGTYISFMIIQRQLCRLQYSMVLQLLERVEALKAADSSLESDDHVFFQMQPLNELYRSRLLQILHRASSRFWIAYQQTKVFPSYFFDAEIEKSAREAQLGTIRAQREALVSAVLKYAKPEGPPFASSAVSHSLHSPEIPFQPQEHHQQQEQTSGDTGLPLPQLSEEAESFQTQHAYHPEGEQLQTSLYQHYSPSAFSQLAQQDVGAPAATPVPLSSESHFSWMYEVEAPSLMVESSRHLLPQSQYASSSAPPDDAAAPAVSAAAASVGQQPSVGAVPAAIEAAESTEQPLTTDTEGASTDLGEDMDAVELLQLIEQTVGLGLSSEEQETGDE